MSICVINLYTLVSPNVIMDNSSELRKTSCSAINDGLGKWIEFEQNAFHTNINQEYNSFDANKPHINQKSKINYDSIKLAALKSNIDYYIPYWFDTINKNAIDSFLDCWSRCNNDINKPSYDFTNGCAQLMNTLYNINDVETLLLWFKMYSELLYFK
jgi:hypothetical protein